MVKGCATVHALQLVLIEHKVHQSTKLVCSVHCPLNCIMYKYVNCAKVAHTMYNIALWEACRVVRGAQERVLATQGVTDGICT